MERKATVLKALVQQRRLTFETFRQAYEQTAQQLGMDGLSIEARQFDRWLNGEVQTLPYPNACRVLETLFERPVRELFSTAAQPDQPGLAAAPRQAAEASPLALLGAGAAVEQDGGSQHGRGDGVSGPAAGPTALEGEREFVMAAAHESSDHAGSIESSGLGANTLEQLSDDVTRLARSYVYVEPLPLLNDLVRVRNRVFRLLNRTQHPHQQTELLLVAGELCGLLASVSFDLGYPEAAAEQIRSAWTYGTVIDHPELCAWSKGLQATIAFWSGRPRDALQLVEHGLSYAPSGTARIRLLCIAGRAWANIGSAAQTAQAIADARRVRDDDAAMVADLHDRIGGEFGFSPARQAFCSGSAHLQVGQTTAAIEACQEALARYAGSAREERWYAAESSARSDLAAAYLQRGDLEGAQEALSNVFALPPQQRVKGLVRRMNGVRDLLTRAPYTDSPPARDLGEQIEDFTADTVAALPASFD